MNKISTAFLRLIGRVLDRRGGRGDQNSPITTIRSTSLEEDDLVDIAQRIKPEGKSWRRFETEIVANIEWAIPEFQERHAYFTTGSMPISRKPKGQKSSEIANGRAEFPWHLSENYLPPSFRAGQWMVDLSIEREDDHSKYSNLIHEWVLPRRLGFDPFF